MALTTVPLVFRDVSQIFIEKSNSRPSCDKAIVSILKHRANTKTSTTQKQRVHSLRCSSAKKNRVTEISAGVQDFETVSSAKLEETEAELQTRLDEEDIADIMQILELLQTKRDMVFNETRLAIMIEDPREVERRRQLGIEADIGCSREDLGEALAEVHSGKVPEDRVVLRALAEEMRNWPNLEEEINEERAGERQLSPYAKVTDTGVDPKIAARQAKRDAWDAAADVGPQEEEVDIGEKLPPIVGYGFLYLLSGIPIIIGITVVVILFVNSLQ